MSSRRRVLATCAAFAVAGCGRLSFDDVPDARSVDSGPNLPAGCAGPDEDADGWPDACDNCPTEPNPDQANILESGGGFAADGVGDACDPRPRDSGDYVVLFESHGSMGGYNHGGTWTYPGNGALRLGSTSGVGAAFFDVPLTTTRADAAFEVIEPGTTGTAWFGIWLDVAQAPSADAVFGCARDAFGDAMLADAVIKQQQGSGDAYSPSIPLNSEITAGMHLRLVLDTVSATSGPYRLRLTDLATASVQETERAIVFGRSPRGYLEVNQAVVDIAYFIVYAM